MDKKLVKSSVQISEAIKRTFEEFKKIGNLSVQLIEDKNTVVVKIEVKPEYLDKKSLMAKTLDVIIRRAMIGSSYVTNAGADEFEKGVFIYFKYKDSNRAKEALIKFQKAIE